MKSRLFFLRKWYYVVITLILFSTTTWITVTNDYMTYRDVSVIVVDKEVGRYHSLYLVVYNSEWGNFEVPVGPTTYSRAQINSRVVFNLREFDIRQTASKNLVYFFGQLIFGILSGAYLVHIFYFFFWGYKTWDKESLLAGFASPIPGLPLPIFFGMFGPR